MIDKNQIIALAEQGLEGSPLFLVEVEVLPGDRIQVFLDSEEGVNIDDCVRISRLIEGSLDREVQDFELMVSSAGMDRPLKHPRQFTKAIGKPVVIRLADGKKAEGILRAVDAEGYTLEAEAPTGSKKPVKKDTETQQRIPAENVREVRRAIRFR
ncbi:MAG TPA: ribosome assembly cofactor RimP [Bacteroidales bacterium]|nr:ribosome assembly cofactor RimP [Bacteroidales bacterium]HRZ75838.1 ribosome assembly cofactor RimP [Bacteroidales bacterium]